MKSILLFFILLVVAAYTNAQNNSTDSLRNSQLQSIDKLAQEINNNLANYKKTVKVDDSTGHCYNYIQGNELKLKSIEVIDKWHGGKAINKFVNWYFNNGQEIFAEQVWKDAATGKIVDKEKTYINNGQLLAWYKMDKPVDPASSEFKDLIPETATYAEGLAKYATKVKEENKQ